MKSDSEKYNEDQKRLTFGKFMNCKINGTD